MEVRHFDLGAHQHRISQSDTLLIAENHGCPHTSEARLVSVKVPRPQYKSHPSTFNIDVGTRGVCSIASGSRVLALSIWQSFWTRIW